MSEDSWRYTEVNGEKTTIT